VLLALLIPSLGAASPQDEQEQVALAWIEAFNRGVEAMATFRSDNVATPDMPDWQDIFGSMREQWGQLEVYGVMIPEAGTVTLGVDSENEGRMRLNFVFDDANRISGLRIGEGASNPIPELELPAGDPVAAIGSFLGDLASDDMLSGSVLLATDGDIWFERAYGLASREFNVPNTLETRFDVGSFNKDYTRLAIIQLLQNDRLALSDKVVEYLPDYPNDRVRNEVTVEHLLEHRSGLGDYFTNEWLETPMGALREIGDYIPIWGPKPLEYEPGTREQYSNFGYTVLGAIVESITGQQYDEYVQEHIFAPAGMNDTGFFATDGIEPNVAVGYTTMDRTGRAGETLRKNIYHEPVKGGPWGKSYSTAADLFRFFDALIGGRLIDDELNWMTSGWYGQTALAGGGPGLSAVLLIEEGLAVIVLANHDEPVAEHIAGRLQSALLDR
jgi:CubicO group peptidase (beta-lactamase class C family)